MLLLLEEDLEPEIKLLAKKRHLYHNQSLTMRCIVKPTLFVFMIRVLIFKTSSALNA